ncbi:MAG: hypothetical protein MUO68_04450 [Desulfobacteraceae bacterium]|nr:hypothetical protein [Desulfobacteraceae bacterium]
MSKLKGLLDLVQVAIDKGATSVEDVQKAVANQPLNILEKIAPLKTPVKGIKEIQNQTIGSVYDIIRTINQEVNVMAKDLLAKVENVTHSK